MAVEAFAVRGACPGGGCGFMQPSSTLSGLCCAPSVVLAVVRVTPPSVGRRASRLRVRRLCRSCAAFRDSEELSLSAAGTLTPLPPGEGGTLTPLPPRSGSLRSVSRAFSPTSSRCSLCVNGGAAAAAVVTDLRANGGGLVDALHRGGGVVQGLHRGGGVVDALCRGGGGGDEVRNSDRRDLRGDTAGDLRDDSADNLRGDVTGDL